MTLRGKKNHYNVKLLSGYGLSLKLKDNHLVLTNGYDPFTSEQQKEEWFITNLPYEKIVISGRGYLSTEAISLLCSHYKNIVITDQQGHPVSLISGCMQSLTATKYRIGQYDTFRNPEKCKYLGCQTIKAKLESQIRFLESLNREDAKQTIEKLRNNLNEINESNFGDVERKSAKIYWSYYTTLFDPRLGFVSRNQSSIRITKRNASDPINALLNYGYAVLAGEVCKFVNGFGLDPYFGYMHRQDSGSIALVSDVMEPFRWLVEKAVYNIANTSSSVHKLRFKDFAWTKDGTIVLSDRIKTNFLEKLERIFQSERLYEFKHGRKCINEMSMCQEITIVKTEIQHLSDYCLEKENGFMI